MFCHSSQALPVQQHLLGLHRPIHNLVADLGVVPWECAARSAGLRPRDEAATAAQNHAQHMPRCLSPEEYLDAREQSRLAKVAQPLLSRSCLLLLRWSQKGYSISKTNIWARQKKFIFSVAVFNSLRKLSYSPQSPNCNA